MDQSTIPDPSTITITDENVDDMIDVAEGYIHYWASEARQLEKDHSKEEQVCIFASYDGDVRTVHYLTRDDIRAAFRRLLTDRTLNDTIRGYLQSCVDHADESGLELGDFDAECGDVVIQVAAFGQIVYS